MKQAVQNIKDGDMTVVDIPVAAAHGKGILVRNVASIVSSGTERQMLEFGQKSLVGKAMERPDLACESLQVMDQGEKPCLTTFAGESPKMLN